MNDYEQQFQKLKKLLIGKTITNIEESNNSEGICKITTNNNTCFTLCATDLGFWIQEESNKEGYFQTLNGLIVGCFYYAFQLDSIDDFDILYDDKEVIFINDTAEFKIKTSSLSQQELKIINSEIGRNLLKISIGIGEGWAGMFSKMSGDCPEELYLL